MAAKVSNLVCSFLFRLLLPLVLLAASIVRYNVLSFGYLVFLLVLPLLRSPTAINIKGGTGVYLIFLIVISALGTLAHAIFHITLASIATDSERYGYDFSNCSTNEKIARTIAVERLDGVPFVHILRLVFPDVAVLITSILVYVISRKFLTIPAVEEPSESTIPLVTTRSKSRQRIDTIIQYIGEFLVVLFLLACGIIVPSLIGAVYFLSFLFIATWWSFYHRLGRKFAIFRVIILVWSGLHLLVLYLCQFQYVQENVLAEQFSNISINNSSSLPQRLLGLTPVIQTNCDRPWEVEFYDASNWPLFLNPVFVLLLYIIVAVETKKWCTRKRLPSDYDKSNIQTSRKKRNKSSLERQVLPHLDEQHENLVDEDQLSYSTFKERVEKKAEEPGTPTMVDSDDEADGGTEVKSKDRLRKKKNEVKRSTLTSIFVYIMKQSYVLTLIAMMVWGINFHSWLTFVLLLGACFIWMVPQSRRACLLCSPFIMFYGEALLIIQYIYGLNLTTSELPVKVGEVDLQEIGLKRRDPYPCLALAPQVLFTSMFWLAVRQFMRERMNTFPSSDKEVPMQSLGGATESNSSTPWFNIGGIDLVDGYDGQSITSIGSYVWEFLAKYWIFVCTGMMLIISMQDVVIYRIIYLFLLLFFILAFQLWYKLWRVTMFVFWWVVIVYSMIVLIGLYIYQFKEFPRYFQSTGLSEKVLSDIGLRQFDTVELFTQLLTPTSFLIVIILQVHYFHKRFLFISNIEKSVKESSPLTLTSDTEDGTTTDTEIYRKTKRWRRQCRHFFMHVWQKCSNCWKVLAAILWRVTEIHIVKVVVFVIIMVCVSEVSCISAVYVIIVSLFLPITGAWLLMSHLCQIWTAIVLLAKMLYQLELVEKDYWNSNCTTDMNGTNITATFNNAEYVGLNKTNNFLYYAKNYIGILLIIALERIVYYHQKQKQHESGMPKLLMGIIFLEVKRQDADKGLLSCAKFFANYFFYKYGLEICYIMFAVTISIRKDVFSVVYAIILGVILFVSRPRVACLWPCITIFLALLLPIQYIMVLGLPEGLCLKYPWDTMTQVDRNLEKWLFLPDYQYPQEIKKLVADFFVLLFVCLQWLVFRRESNFRKDRAQLEEYGGGDNSDILPEVEANKPIPVGDFTSHVQSYLDVIKNGFFTYMFWATLFIVLLTGTIRINVFSLGYVIIVFFFMWYGKEFILKPLSTMRKKWKILIAYTYAVLLLKAALQLLGCVYIADPRLNLYNDQCWLVQLLGLTCLSPAIGYKPDYAGSKCVVEEDDTGLAWDVVCFTFLLLQLKIYNSHYFRHVVASTQAQNNLASRGAQLINNILIKEVQEQKEAEARILQGIKEKMEYLKNKQKRTAKADYIETEEHFQAIRSGDYYLFDEDDYGDEDPTSLSLGKDKSEDEDEGLDPVKLISTAIDSGAEAAVKQSEEADNEAEKSNQGVQECQEDEESEDKEPTKLDKVKNVLKLICKLVESLADTLIDIFNNISKNYRMVAEAMEDDVKKEKDKIQASKKDIKVKEEKIEIDSGAEDGGAEDGGTSAESKPLKETDDLVEIEIDVPDDGGAVSDEKSLDDPAQSAANAEKKEKFEKSKPKVFQLLEATYYVIVSRSEIVCYFLMFLNMILNASLLSLPLPLMVFLWGMLSVPRPSKTFWVTVITYTEAVIVVKYLFQFGFFPWNSQTTIELDPFWPPRILGIEKKSYYATGDIILLVMLFIHRSILKQYGLWKDADDISADFSKAEMEMSTPTTPVFSKELALERSAETEESAHFSEQKESSSSIEEGKVKEKKKKQKPSITVFLEPFKNFYRQLTNPAYNATTDVYASMFLCDFINSLILVLGYSSFGPASAGSGDVTSYIKDNKIPVPFLIMMLIQFFMIVVDRGLYLRKNILGKFIYQIILVIFIHIYIFIAVPKFTERSLKENVPAILFYLVKCIYFALSASQIRSSYPTRILGNFLTKKYNYLNLFLFKGFLAIPFLLELRVLMDWMWTDSTLAIGSWLQMEDIYANIYVLKCWREAEKKYPTPRSVKKRSLIKYLVGGLLLVLIIFAVWFPLVLFSFANTVFVANPPVQVSTVITIGGYQPLFQVQAQGNSIKPYSAFQYKSMLENYKEERSVTNFINSYEKSDINSVSLNGQSTSNWGISPPSKSDLIKSLNDSNSVVKVEFDISFRREPSAASTGQTVSNQFIKKLSYTTKQKLMNMIENPLPKDATSGGVTIEELFPKFYHLSSTVSHEESMLQVNGRSNISVMFKTDFTNGTATENEWWEVQEYICGTKTEPKPCDGSRTLEEDITLVTFNDRVAPPGLFSTITGYGIIGLYVSLVLLIGRFVRSILFSGQSTRIMYEELPYVDRILQLCMNIYLVRECQNFRLEEDLFAKLIFLYRSPETMYRWTKMKFD